MQRIGYLSATVALAAMLAASASVAEEMGGGAAGDTQGSPTGQVGGQDIGAGDAESGAQPGTLGDPGAIEDEGVGAPSELEAGAETEPAEDATGGVDAPGDIQHGEELDAESQGVLEREGERLERGVTGEVEGMRERSGIFGTPGAIEEQEGMDAGVGAEPMAPEGQELDETGELEATGEPEDTGMEGTEPLETEPGTAPGELEAGETAPGAVPPGAMPEDEGQLGTPGADVDGAVEAPGMHTGEESGAGGYDAPGRIQEELEGAAERLGGEVDAEAAADPELQQENLEQAINPPPASDTGAAEADAEQR